MSMDIGDAIEYPSSSDDWVKTVIIGGILQFLTFLIVPLFLVYGYVLRAIRGSIGGEDEPPVFKDWGDLLVEGLQAWVILLVYMLIPLIVGVVLVGGSMAAMLAGEPGAGVAGMMGGMVVTMVLALVFGYFAVAAVVNFASEERFGAAFDVGRVTDIALTTEFLIPWLVSVVLFLAVGVVAGIPLVGWIVAPFAAFYVTVAAARLWAGGYVDAVGTADSA